MPAEQDEKAIFFHHTGEGEPDETVLPRAAENDYPTWFQQTPAYFDPGSSTGSTVKLCYAFGDALDFGYMIPSPADIRIKRFSNFEIEVVEGEDYVHNYGMQPPTGSGNSMYPVPEIKIDIPWEISTPEGYSSLITPPINRSLEPFEINSLFVPTDHETAPLSLPAVVGPKDHTIEKGEPLASVIPLKRDEVLPYRNVTRDEQPEMFEAADRIRAQLNTQKSLYRKFYHQPKPSNTVENTVSSPAETDGGIKQHQSTPQSTDDRLAIALDNVGRRSEQGEYFTFMTKEYNEGITPGPVDPTEKLPPWCGDLLSHLGEENVESVQQINALDAWMEAASSIGAMEVIPVDLTASQAGEYDDRFFEHRFDGNITRHSFDEKIGPEFPYEIKIAGVGSDRFVATPDGYSTLLTDPFNHYQRNIRGWQGIVDHDVYYDVSNMPSMLFTKNDEFSVEQGAPLFQAITFRRDSMISTAVITSS